MIKGGGSIHAQNVADAYILGNNQPNGIPVGAAAKKVVKQVSNANAQFN